MRRSAVVALLSGLALALAGGAAAASSGPGDSAVIIRKVDVSSFPTVAITVAAGSAATLGRSDFRLFESDGQVSAFTVRTLADTGQAVDVVLAVDTSAEAVAQIVRNAERNGLANVAARDANLFDLLRELHDRGERFDTVILDPPAFAKSKDAVEKAVRGYKEINLRALKLLEPGGCLITCSCSYHVHEADFEEILAAAAADAPATVTVVEKRGQARDHPVVLGVPETYYLKCFVLRRVA